MAYSRQMQEVNLYSYYFAPRGNRRMADLGMQLSQMYLSPFDHIVGIIGDAGAGKSLLEYARPVFKAENGSGYSGT